MSTTAERLRRGTAAAALAGVLLAASACSGSEPSTGPGGDPSGDPTAPSLPTTGAQALDVDFTATTTVSSDALEIEWSLTNNTGDAVLVPNRVPDAEGRFSDSPDTVYIVPGGEPGLAALSKMVLPAAPDAAGDSFPVVGVTELADGKTLTETVRVPLPLETYGPPSPVYDNLELDDPVTSEVFCVGVLPGRDDSWGFGTDGDVTTINHGRAAQDQSVFCSDATALD